MILNFIRLLVWGSPTISSLAVRQLNPTYTTNSKLAVPGLLGLLFLFAANTVAAADIAAGKAAYSNNACAGCHGIAGKSQIDLYPTLAGRSAAYLEGELNKFRSQSRINPTMNAMAARLSDSDIANIATFLSSQ